MNKFNIMIDGSDEASIEEYIETNDEIGCKVMGHKAFVFRK